MVQYETRLSELREKLSTVDFQPSDGGLIAPLHAFITKGPKAFHGQIIADGIPAMLEIAQQVILNQLMEQDG